MKKCIFCQIANKKQPAHIIYEDRAVIVFMDIYPSAMHRGQCLVVSKKHESSYYAEVSQSIYQHTMGIAQKIAKAIDRALKSMRVCMVCEGMEIDHFHVKLYPIYKGTYPNYLSTKKDNSNKGVREKDMVLSKLAGRIGRFL